MNIKVEPVRGADRRSAYKIHSLISYLFSLSDTIPAAFTILSILTPIISVCYIFVNPRKTLSKYYPEKIYMG
jgi:hypothetical protein